MTYSHADVVEHDPIHLGSYGPNSVGLYFATLRSSAPTSGAYASANRIHASPFFTQRPFSLARWWWQNGATVGTNYVQVGIYDENLNIVAASPKTLSAGTANYLQYTTPAISGRNITADSDTTDQDTYTTASVTLKAGRLYLMSVENSHATTTPAVSSIDSATGGYPTFASRATTQFSSSTRRVSIWSAVPTADFTATLRINFGASSGVTGCIWALNEFTHVDTATNDGVVQTATGTGSSTTPLATLAAFGSANNATFGAFGVAAANAGTPSTGYFEMNDNTLATPNHALQTTYRPDNDTTVDETITSAAWGALAAELKSLGTGAITIPPMRGYLAIWCNGTTATFFRISSQELYRPYQYATAAATGGLTQALTLTAGAGTLYNYGFTSRSTV